MDNFHIDHDRIGRLGFPEIIYGQAKSSQVLVAILKDYQDKGLNAMITKLQAEKGKLLLQAYPEAFYDPVSGVFMLRPVEPVEQPRRIGILSAGTSDAFIANEVYFTLAFLGQGAARVMDIGVSGIHRLLSRIETLRQYQVLIVIAGFEGALPTVVGGLLPQPIIAVPTSVGYGVSADGKAALHTMLSSCANGITVVNIDNGYGAAMAAFRMVRVMSDS